MFPFAVLATCGFDCGGTFWARGRELRVIEDVASTSSYWPLIGHGFLISIWLGQKYLASSNKHYLMGISFVAFLVVIPLPLSGQHGR